MRSEQPINQIEWVPPSSLHANDYNPNHVAPDEWTLLRTSLLEDGWTQPIVATKDDEIIDGFHRWTLASRDQDIAELGDGCVPVVRLAVDAAHQRLSTVRHNRARGSHYIAPMVALVRDLRDRGYDNDTIRVRLGMSAVELERMMNYGTLPAQASTGQMGRAWKPTERER